MQQHIQRSSAVFSILKEVEEVCKQQGIDQVKSGPKPQYPDSFIIGLVIIKNLLGMNSESSYLRYLAKHHGDMFITLPERSWFNRKCRKLQPMAVTMQQTIAVFLANVEVKVVLACSIPPKLLIRSSILSDVP